MMQDELLDTAGVAAWLDKPEGTLRQWRHRRVGPQGFRLAGGSVRYRRSVVEAWLRAQEAAEVRPLVS